MSPRIYEELHCSRTMELSLRQHLTYLKTTGRDAEAKIAAWEARYDLPCKDRREGKRILSEIEREIAEIPLPLEKKGKRAPRPFTKLYLEQGIKTHPRAAAILSHFPDLPREEILHYKDVFRRTAESAGRALLLARNGGTLLYPGAPVCQDFGNAHFYYTSCVRNCPFDCEYCYLKGMYPSADLVAFLNLEDSFSAVDRALQQHPVYLCVSYDTDLLALEPIFGFVRAWSEFAETRPHLTIEVRTKGGDTRFFETLPPQRNVVFAFTLSPEPVASAFEHFAPPLSARLAAARRAMELGFPVRLCFDPILYVADWEAVYGEFLEKVDQALALSCVRDIGIGTFRISSEYRKALRQVLPESPVAQYPYENQDGVFCYNKELDEAIFRFFEEKLTKRIEKNRIFWWKSRTTYDRIGM